MSEFTVKKIELETENVRLNSIIEIIRSSPHAGEYKYYRRVVE